MSEIKFKNKYMLKVETGDDNKFLRNISENIRESEIKKFVKIGHEMIKYIKNPKHGGVGLAAPQVGYNKRLIVVSLLKDWDSEESFKTVMMINPIILEHSDHKNIDIEGCLSVPGEKGKVERYDNIRLQYINDKGATQILLLEGLRARIVQHEIDHLDGVLFTDKTLEK